MDELTTLLDSAGLMVAEHACRPMNSETRRQTILACQQLLDRVRVAQSTLIADATTNNDWAGTGARNIADWLAGATKSSYNDAKRKEQLGNALNKSKDLADAVNSGAVSPDAADALADAVNNPPDTATAADIADLVNASEGATPREAKQAASRWREILSTETEEQAHTRRHNARTVTNTVACDGMITTSITLPVLQARQLLNAINHAAGEPVEGDTRTNTQRLADGAIALAQLYNSGQLIPGRANPNIVIVIPVDGFTGVTNEPGHTPWGDRIPAHVVRELAKNATLQRIIMAGSKILDLGRQTRYATHDHYLALVARDGHCRYKDCTTPAAWCEIDHIIQWQHGGTTNINNEWLLCPFHHQQRHKPGTTITGNANNTQINLPNGTTINCPPHGANNRKPEPTQRTQPGTPPGTPPAPTASPPPGTTPTHTPTQNLTHVA